MRHVANTDERVADLAAADLRGGVLRSNGEAAIQPGGDGRVESRLSALPAQPSLLSRIARAEADIADLIDAWSELPEAYVRGSRNWTSYEALERACELISSARADLIG